MRGFTFLSGIKLDSYKNHTIKENKAHQLDSSLDTLSLIIIDDSYN
jgi:hypothetical protein